MIYDITIPLEESIAVWPGDTPFEYRLAWKISEGATVNVGAVSMSTHAGTHVDAPFHFKESGRTVDEIDPVVFIGPAAVVDMSGRESIRRADVESLDLSQTPRVLFETGAWLDHAVFPERIPVMEAGLAGYLRERGVILVGVDVPSVDALDSKDLPIHHELAASGIHIIESLNLAHVAAGRYELIAVPLRVTGADAAPVRAILRSIQSPR